MVVACPGVWITMCQLMLGPIDRPESIRERTTLTARPRDPHGLRVHNEHVANDGIETGLDESVLERYLPELKLAAQHLPFIGQGWAQYLDDVVARRKRRAAAVIAGFSEASGQSFDDLIGGCSGNSRLADIVADVLETSTRTASQRKLRALGRALYLGHIAADDAALDELELMLTAIRDLEVAHIKVLDFLIEHGSRHDAIPDGQLAALFPNGVPIVYAVLKVLEFRGLAGPSTAPSDDPDAAIGWVPWDFGLLVHQELLREGAEPTGLWA
jgi:hypothetical protein